MSPNQYAPYIAPLLVIAIVGWRMSRSLKGRPINPNYLWVRPAIFVVLVGLSFVASLRTDVIALASFAAAVVLGGGAGYMLARHQELSLNEDGTKIISKTSPVGIVLFFLLFAGRYAFRMYTGSGQMSDKVAAHSPQILFYSEVALLFIVAMFCAQAWEIWHRARPLVAERKARIAAKKAGNAAGLPASD